LRKPPVRLRLKYDGTRAEIRFGLSAKRTSPFKSAGASFQSTTGSRVVNISGSNAGYTVFRGSVRVLATHSICQFPLHFPSRASPSAIRFQLESTIAISVRLPAYISAALTERIPWNIIYIYIYIYTYTYIFICSLKQMLCVTGFIFLLASDFYGYFPVFSVLESG
jgi:hypothetical protein